MSRRLLLKALLIAISVFGFTVVEPNVGQAQGLKKLRDDAGKNIAIVFVHGVLGDESTWTNSAGVSWPSLLLRDNAFSAANIYVASYPTTLLSSLATESEAANLVAIQLKAAHIQRHSKIVFVAHSLGGLVVRRVLLRNRDLADRTAFLHLFGTPTDGSDIAALWFAMRLTSNRQFEILRPIDSNLALDALKDDWVAARLRIKTYCAYELVPFQIAGIIVRKQSASALCTESATGIPTNHFDLVKPSSSSSVSYSVFRLAYEETVASEPIPANGTASQSDLKIVDVSADGATVDFKLKNFGIAAAFIYKVDVSADFVQDGIMNCAFEGAIDYKIVVSGKEVEGERRDVPRVLRLPSQETEYEETYAASPFGAYFSERWPSKEFSVEVSQSVPPKGLDRFRVTFVFEPKNSGCIPKILRGSARLFHDGDQILTVPSFRIVRPDRTDEGCCSVYRPFRR
jgi:pimeloyl-ACP methyl ester carboxylesterase